MSRKKKQASASAVPRTRRSVELLRRLYQWFLRHGARGPSAAFEDMVDFLADCVRLQPLPKDKGEEATLGEPFELAKQWVEAWLLNDRLEDDLGTVMEVDASAMSERHGQFLTPVNVARGKVKMLLDGREPSEGEVVRLLDPACGTGRFSLAGMEESAPYDKGRYLYCAVDIDLRMVRVAMLNFYMANFWRIRQGYPPALWRVAWGDFLAVDFIQRDAWRHANQWDPPHWSDLPRRRPLGAPAALDSFDSEQPPPAPLARPTVVDVEPSQREPAVAAAKHQDPEEAPPRPTVLPQTPAEGQNRAPRAQKQVTFDFFSNES